MSKQLKFRFWYILQEHPVQCVEKHHQLSACLFVQRFAAKKQYKDVKAVMITYFCYISLFLEKFISWVCKSCLSKYLFVSAFVLQWNLTVWHFQGSRFGQRMKIFTSFPPWLTNTVRACIQIFYLLATNTTWICKKYVFLLNSFGHRRKIFTRFPPLVDNLWKIWWEHGHKSYEHQTNQYKQYWQTKISQVTLSVI